MKIESDARNVTLREGEAIYQVIRREGESAQEAIRNKIELREKRIREALIEVERLKRALKILGIPPVPDVKMESSCSFYCDGEGLRVYGDSPYEAEENWREAYVAEYIGDVSF
jgi:predicted DNA-binding antitoxin AbrB/MazE fold protein